MLPEKLIDQLRNLDRADKLRAMQVLVSELAEEDALLKPGTAYDLLTPYGNDEAAQVLTAFLNASSEMRE
jgi:hypothetical protein